MDLVKCTVFSSKWSGRCYSKAHNLGCTQLCKSQGTEDTCNNVAIDENSSDNVENEDLDN